MNNLYKIIVINLNKDKDRLDYMSNQLNSLNMSFDRLEAVRGREYIELDGSEYDEKYTVKKTGRKMTLYRIKKCFKN